MKSLKSFWSKNNIFDQVRKNKTMEKKMDIQDYGIFIKSNDFLNIGRMEMHLGVNIEIGEWVLKEEVLDILAKPSLFGNKYYTFLTLKAIKELYPKINCNRIYFKGQVMSIEDKNGQIIVDKI